MGNNNSIYGNLDSLFLFCSIIENGSVSKAAEVLGIPSSTISRRMNLFEEAMGAKLLRPFKRELVPTEKGKELYNDCHANLWQIDQTLSGFQSKTQQVTGTVRITIPRAFYYDVARKAIRGLMKDYPKVTFVIRLFQQPEAPFIDNDTDILMAFNLENLSNCVAKPLYKTKLGIFANIDFFKDKKLPDKITDLQNYPWICNYDLKTVSLYKDYEFEFELPIDLRFVVSDIYAASDEIKAGFGIGLIPIAKALKHKEMIRIFPDYNWKIRQAYLVYRKTKYFPFIIHETAKRIQNEAIIWSKKNDDWDAEKIPL